MRNVERRLKRRHDFSTTIGHPASLSTKECLPGGIEARGTAPGEKYLPRWKPSFYFPERKLKGMTMPTRSEKTSQEDASRELWIVIPLGLLVGAIGGS